MYYIQRYSLIERKEQRFLRGVQGFSRFMSCDYMGSAEFEFGSVGRSWMDIIDTLPDIKRIDLDVELRGKPMTIPVFVMACPELVPYVKEKLLKHFDMKRLGSLTKEHTGFREAALKMYCGENDYFTRKTVLWIDVSEHITDNQDSGKAVVFSLCPKYIIKVYLEAYRLKNLGEEEPDLRIGDFVYKHKQRRVEEFKVVGISPGPEITLLHGTKRTKVSVFDVIPKDVVKDHSFVDMINSLDLSLLV